MPRGLFSKNFVSFIIYFCFGEYSFSLDTFEHFSYFIFHLGLHCLSLVFLEKFFNIQNIFTDHHHIYPDGSKQGMKVGCAAISQNQELLKCLPNESSMYSAEVIAIDLAMRIIANHKSSKFIIYSASKSVLQALQNKDTLTHLITELLNKMNTLSKNNSIILTWIPNHVEIEEQAKLQKKDS